MRRYLQSYICTNLLFLAAVVAVFCWPFSSLHATFWSAAQDHPGAIGNRDWYMNFRRLHSTQALDRDVMYHHIGHSMEHARDADIIILGHSMALFAFDWRLLRKFSKKYGVKFFNLASGGDMSGDFLLRVAQKNGLRPKIWLINADDHGTDFFSDYVSAIAKGEAADVMSYGSTRAMLNTFSKDLKWRFDLLLQNMLPRSVVALIYSAEPIFNYRSAQDGNWRNDDWPGFRASNPIMANDREPDCHATPEVIAAAKKYVQRLGSGDVVLTLIPHSNSCRTRVQEIAAALGVPFLAVDWKNMTTFDGGGHLDAEGAKKFTEAVLDQLVHTKAFHEAVAKAASESALK
jgi:hypothetical protein